MWWCVSFPLHAFVQQRTLDICGPAGRQVRTEVWTRINQVFGRVSGVLKNGTPPDGLCLLDASIFLWTGETMHVPCLRIPLDQVVAWYGGAPRFDKAGSGGGWFVGGLFPVGD